MITTEVVEVKFRLTPPMKQLLTRTCLARGRSLQDGMVEAVGNWLGPDAGHDFHPFGGLDTVTEHRLLAVLAFLKTADPDDLFVAIIDQLVSRSQPAESPSRKRRPRKPLSPQQKGAGQS